jgi:hypothetical protein
VDPKSAHNEHWFAKPVTESVHCRDFDAIWNAALQTTTEFSFTIDRRDPRNGWLTTLPLVSKQPFEFWRQDVVGADASLQATLATMRRVVHIQIRKLEDGSFVCEPKAVVERYAMPERRITSVTQYREAFSATHNLETASSEEGEVLRAEYWYATGRDSDLERALADSMRRKLTALAQNR